MTVRYQWWGLVLMVAVWALPGAAAHAQEGASPPSVVPGVAEEGAGGAALGPGASLPDLPTAEAASEAELTAEAEDEIEEPVFDEESVVLNFEGADIREVIHSLAGALGISYSIDPRIEGLVTIRTTGKIAKRDLFPIFNQILRSNGMAAMPVGDIYQIVPIEEAKTKAIIPRTEPDARRHKEQDRFAIELIEVQHVDAQEMANILEPFISPGGEVFVYARANVVVLTDLASNINRLRDLVATFDRDAFRDLHAKVFKVENVDVVDLSEELLAILDTYGVTPQGAEVQGLYIIPLARLGSIVVVSFNEQLFPHVAHWLEMLDVPPEEGAGRTVFVYRVENTKAGDLAAILNELYATGPAPPGGTTRGVVGRPGVATGGAGVLGTGTRRSGRRRGSTATPGAGGLSLQQRLEGGGAGALARQVTPRQIGGRGGQLQAQQQRAARRGAAPQTLAGVRAGAGGPSGIVIPGGEPGALFLEEVRIVADEVTNSLLILATRRDYEQILDVLRKVDVVPRQVLIEVLIAEVTLNDTMEFGVQWAISNNEALSDLGTRTGANPFVLGDTGLGLGTNISDVAAPPGLGTFFGIITDNDTFEVFLNALAGQGLVRILSNPHIIAADNTEAHILVGVEEPVSTQQSQSTLTGTAPIVQNIQYRDTGVILTVLPQVNSEGLVNLQVRQEISKIGDSREIAGGSFPSFSTRESETTLVVQDGDSIIIGGIISEDKTYDNSGVPFLMDIPAIGRLFRVERETMDRTELILLITPHVMRDRDEAGSITAEFKRRVEGLVRSAERMTQ